MNFQEFLEKKGFEVISELNRNSPENQLVDQPKTSWWRRALGLGGKTPTQPVSSRPVDSGYQPMALAAGKEGGLGSTRKVGSDATRNDYLYNQFDLIHNALSRMYNSAQSLELELKKFPQATGIRSRLDKFVQSVKTQYEFLNDTRKSMKQMLDTAGNKLPGKGSVVDRAQQMRQSKMAGKPYPSPGESSGPKQYEKFGTFGVKD